MTRPRRFDLIAFDWDGTLYDSTKIIVRCIQEAVRDVGGRVPADTEAAYVIGMGLMQALAHAAPDVPIAPRPPIVPSEIGVAPGGCSCASHSAARARSSSSACASISAIDARSAAPSGVSAPPRITEMMAVKPLFGESPNSASRGGLTMASTAPSRISMMR